MLKANAWPYSVFEDVRYRLASVHYGQLPLPSAESSKGVLVDCSSLRERSSGAITVRVRVETTPSDVCAHVFEPADAADATAGMRALCKESKFRKFFAADGNGNVIAELPLERLRGGVQLETMFLAAGAVVTRDGVAISAGAVLSISQKPIIITLDEDWTGETIPVDWLDFEARGLAKGAFIHVELSGGSQVPRVWLNAAYRTQIEGVLVRTGDNSPAALAGAAMRQFVWQHVWERVVLWAVREESSEDENWPSTRIAKSWRERFAEQDWQLPSPDNLDVNGVNELSLRIQHCLLAAQNLARVNGLFRFQPEARGAV
jgi:hypothetical protein